MNLFSENTRFHSMTLMQYNTSFRGSKYRRTSASYHFRFSKGRCYTVMERWNCFHLISIRCVLCFVLLLAVRVAEADPCVSLVNSSFEICTNAGYDTTTPFPSYFTAAIKSDIAAEVIHAINLTRNCAVKGLAEAIECSPVVPKCNSLGRPILPCREVCAEFLKQCEFHLDVFNLDYLISFCLVLPTNSSNCAPCMVPPNFTTNSSVPGEYVPNVVARIYR